MSQPFDHDAHLRKLEKAAEYLAAKGMDDLAGAVRRARSIHIDMVGRMAEGRRVRKRLEEAAEGLRQLGFTMDQYVTQPRGPWIGADLFPPNFPDGNEEG